MHIMRLTLGDWSDDGHGRYQVKTIVSSHSLEDVRQAYKTSCEKYGVELHKVCSGYDDWEFPGDVVSKFQELGCSFEDIIEDYENSYNPIKNSICPTPEDYAKIILWYIGLSLEKFAYKDINIPSINGYWSDLNVSFGYGLFQ